MSYVNVKTDCDTDNAYCKSKKAIVFEGTQYEKRINIAERMKDAAFVDSFINPNGTQYYVGSCGHSHFAYDHADTDTTTLEEAGWIHFSKAFTRSDTTRAWPVVGIIVNEDVIPTQAQLDTLFDIFMDAVKENKRFADNNNGVPSERIAIQAAVIDEFIKKNRS